MCFAVRRLFGRLAIETLHLQYSACDYREHLELYYREGNCAFSTAERVINRNIQAVVLGAVLRFNKRLVAEDPFSAAVLAFMFFPCAVGLCLIVAIPAYLYDEAGNLVDRTRRLKP